uniref:Mos1 transposase HTH domain-containing protein n=1 Tax=Acrobeloides nanus TaxID=290746 RepID=A0A914DZD2_9BILA
MLYHFENRHKAAEAFRDLNELFGKGTIGERQVRRWFERFKSGNTSLEDKGGRGRPSDFDDQVLLAAVEEDESLTTRMLAEQFDVDHSIIVRWLNKLGKVWKLDGCVPHELSEDEPDLKRSNHLRTCLLPIVPSLNSSLRSRKASAALCPFLK